ncbi:MAG TPA: DMT family transporter [Mycobacteriales bacterium]|nr:DMT family transporter [Mycobacteriales bacterium]
MDARIATALSVAAGAALAVQARVNGSLTEQLGHGSAVPTATVSFAAGTAMLVVAVLLGGRQALARQSWHAWRTTGRPVRVWWFLGGLGGASMVGSTAYAVPLVGVAFATVAAVSGQLIGSALVDAVGVGPGGRHTPTRYRIAGVVLALAGLVLAAAGRSGAAGGARLGLLLLVGGTGILVALQQAANGHAQRVTGDAVVAAVISFAGGAVALFVTSTVLLASGAVGPLHQPGLAHWWMFFGGAGGASYIALSAATVRSLGVLTLSLGLTAGQLVAGLLLDATLPAGEHLRWTTVAGAALAVGAVVVVSREASASRRSG